MQIVFFLLALFVCNALIANSISSHHYAVKYQTEYLLQHQTIYQQPTTFIQQSIANNRIYYLNSFFEQHVKHLLSKISFDHKNACKYICDSSDWNAILAFGSAAKTEPFLWDLATRHSLFENIDLWIYQSYRAFLDGLAESKITMIAMFEQSCKGKMAQLDNVILDTHQTAYQYLAEKVAQYTALDWLAYFQQKYANTKPLEQWSSAERLQLFKDAELYLKKLENCGATVGEHGLVKLLKMCPEYKAALTAMNEFPGKQLLLDEFNRLLFHERLEVARKEFAQTYEKYLQKIQEQKQDLETCKNIYISGKNCTNEFKSIFEAREKVLDLMLKGKQDIATRTYDERGFVGSFISPSAKQFLLQFNLFESFREITGTILQHHLHTEICAIANAFTELSKSIQAIPQVAATMIADHLKQAHDFIVNHQLSRASIALDFCWGFLGYLKGNLSAIKNICSGHRSVEYMRVCVDCLRRYDCAEISKVLVSHLSEYTVDYWEHYAKEMLHLNIDASSNKLDWQKLFEQVDLYQFTNFVTLLKRDPDYEVRLLSVGDKILSGELRLQQLSHNNSWEFIRSHLDGVQPELWSHTEFKTNLQGDTKVGLLVTHRLPCASYQTYVKSQPQYKDHIIDFYQRVSDQDGAMIHTLRQMPESERGTVLGYISKEYHELTNYMAWDRMIKHERQNSGVFAKLAASIVGQKSTPITTDSFDFKVFWEKHLNQHSSIKSTLFSEYIPAKGFLGNKSDGTPEIILLYPSKQESYQVPDAGTMTQRFSELNWYERQTRVWKPFIVDIKEFLSRLDISDLGLETLRNYLHQIFCAYPEQLTMEGKMLLYSAFNLYKNPAYVALLRNIPDSLFYFAEVAQHYAIKNWPKALKVQLQNMTCHDWMRALEVAQREFRLSAGNLLHHYAGYIKLFQFSQFKECLKQFPNFDCAMIDMALTILNDNDLYKQLEKIPDATDGNVARYLQKCLEKADLKTMQDYCQWRFGRSINDLLPEQKHALFTNWSAWGTYSYINLLRSIRDFESFVLKAVQDKQLMKQLAKYQSLKGRGTIAEHMRSLAKGFFESYHGNWHNTSFYNGQRSAAMCDLLPEERYHFYRDPFMFTHQEGAEYLKSFGHEYDAWMRRLSYELEDNAALKQQFANITAHDGYKMLDYVQREAYQAQKRYEHEVQQATYDLAQHLETLNQLKVDYLKKAEQELCLPATRERFINRAQAIERFICGNRTVSVCDYQITQEAKKIIQKLGLNEYELRQFTGNVIQQELHGELITIINEAGKLKNALTGQELIADQLGMLLHTSTDYIGEYVSLAHEYNKSPQSIEKAWAVSDICWGIFDCLCALDEGVQQGFASVGHIIAHPIDTAIGMAHGTWMIADGLMRLEALGDLYEFNEALAQQKIDSYTAQLNLVVDTIKEQAQNLKARDVVRGVAGFATESYLSAKVLAITASFLDKARQKAVVLTEKIGEVLTKESAILKTVEGFEAKVGGDVAEQMCKMAGEQLIRSAFDKAIFDKYIEKIKHAHHKFKDLGLNPISKRDLKHILINHVPGGQAAFVGKKSVFDKSIDIIELAIEGWEKGVVIGDFEKIYDTGKIIGLTCKGIPTSKVRIALNGTKDSIRTLYPIG